MKKIINGKLYDTETARELGSWSNMADRRDFSQFEETLYRKKTGEYFLHGEGGPMTKYAVASGTNSWSGGSRIMPMTYAEAREWAEKHLGVDEYEAAFGPVAEDADRVTIHLGVSAVTVDALRRRASELGITVGAYVDRLVAGSGAGKIYYFPDASADLDSIFGDQQPVCMDEAEILRLSREWDTDLMAQCHEASADEISRYGIYDS